MSEVPDLAATTIALRGSDIVLLGGYCRHGRFQEILKNVALYGEPNPTEAPPIEQDISTLISDEAIDKLIEETNKTADSRDKRKAEKHQEPPAAGEGEPVVRIAAEPAHRDVETVVPQTVTEDYMTSLVLLASGRPACP